MILEYTTKDGYKRLIAGITTDSELAYELERAKKDGAQRVINRETREEILIK